MAHIIADRIKEASTTTGTGVFTLSGAMVGSRAFSTVMSNNDTCYYCIDDDAGNWEIGLGTYNASTLARTSVMLSSNANSLVDFPAGAKAVFITNPAINIPILSSGTFVPVLGGGTITGAGTYTTQSGTYTRIGNLVFFTIDLAWSAHTGTGTMLISGLPFTPTQLATCPLSFSTLTFSGVPVGKISPGSSIVELVYATSGGAVTGIAMDTTASFTFSGVYQVA